jgi:protein TonB
LQTDSLQRPLAGSLVTHAVIVGLVAASGYLHLTDKTWGSEHASSGSVGVSMVPNIPIPRNEGPLNPVANDTKNPAPQEVTPVKAKPVVKAPEPDAVPLRSLREKPKKVADKPQPPANTFKPMKYQANQVYTKTPQSMSSPMYGMQGSGGIDIGPASVLGTRFGAYVNLMRSQIAQHWNTSGMNAAPNVRCGVSFTIARNGSVSNVQITQPSGNYLLDTSAKRAILDSNPLPSLPTQYSGSEVPVELWFQLKQ